MPFIHTDVAKEADVKAAVDFTVKTDGRLDAALLNASIEIACPLDQVTEEQYQNAFNINVWGVNLGNQQFISQFYTQP